MDISIPALDECSSIAYIVSHNDDVQYWSAYPAHIMSCHKGHVVMVFNLFMPWRALSFPYVRRVPDKTAGQAQ